MVGKIHGTKWQMAGFLLLLFVIAAFLAGSRILLPIGEAPAGASLTAITYATTCTVWAALLSTSLPGSSGSALAWAGATTAVLAAVLVIDPLTRSLWPHMPALLITVFFLTATISVFAKSVAGSIVAPLVISLTFAPIWAASLVELLGNPAILNRIVISVSPLTAFSVALEFDYLRTEFFYTHSVLGSMRYTYPGWLGICSLFAIVPATVAFRYASHKHGQIAFHSTGEVHS